MVQPSGWIDREIVLENGLVGMAIEMVDVWVETVTVPTQGLTASDRVANVKLTGTTAKGDDTAPITMKIQGDIAAIIYIIGITIDTEDICIPGTTIGIIGTSIPGLTADTTDISIPGLIIDIKDICTIGLTTAIIGPEKIGKLFCHQIV